MSVVPMFEAHDDADCLPELHDTRVDQADEHDRHSGRGLDGNGDDRTERHAREAVLRHRFEGALQRAPASFPSPPDITFMP